MNQHHHTPHGHHFGPNLDCERCGEHYGIETPCVPTRPICPVCGGTLRLLGPKATELRCRPCENARRKEERIAELHAVIRGDGTGRAA